MSISEKQVSAFGLTAAKPKAMRIAEYNGLCKAVQHADI